MILNNWWDLLILMFIIVLFTLLILFIIVWVRDKFRPHNCSEEDCNHSLKCSLYN